ncbi:thiol reductant ABC exporter subunit CydD [Jeotgalibacillus marinus]|uniref:Thiol reductant ABC exporter subunit CydD n=1 Tax=Jeotgalibacillus marinus TaxID=86667 RepID=A0ABV3Q9B9_9BACL
MNELKSIAKTYKGTRMFLVLIAILSGMTIIGQAYFIVAIVERIFLLGQSFGDIVPLLGWLALVLVARAGLTFLSGRAGVRMAAKVKNDFHRKLVTKFLRNPVQSSLQGQSGQKVSVMMDAVDEVDSYFSHYVPQVIQTSIVPLMIIVVAFTQHMYTGLLMLITAPFIPLFFIIIGIKTQKKSEEQMDKMATFSGRFLDTLQGLTTLKLFGRAAQQKESIRKSSLDFRDATMSVLKVAFVSSLMLEYISMLSIGLIALELGLRLVLFESVTFFTAFFLLVLAPEFYLALKELGSAFHTGRGSMGAAKKIADELAQKEQAVEWGEARLDTTVPPAIALRGVGFQYGEQGFALKDIQADIKPYEQVAIVGRSGAGKSTLLHLLAGLIGPTRGEMIVEGRSLSDYKEADWFDGLSYISQHPYLFAGTIAENISIGCKEQASHFDIEEAAKKAGIAELIESLEKGYDTPVGEAGRGLSGGEKQRVALARAFLKKPSVILFDEPTTGLDLHTERILQASIKELSQGSTVITVAHRLHTIKHADHILFLANGELVAQGTHDELMKSTLEYRNMVSVQQGGVTE